MDLEYQGQSQSLTLASFGKQFSCMNGGILRIRLTAHWRRWCAGLVRTPQDCSFFMSIHRIMDKRQIHFQHPSNFLPTPSLHPLPSHSFFRRKTRRHLPSTCTTQAARHFMRLAYKASFFYNPWFSGAGLVAPGQRLCTALPHPGLRPSKTLPSPQAAARPRAVALRRLRRDIF